VPRERHFRGIAHGRHGCGWRHSGERLALMGVEPTRTAPNPNTVCRWPEWDVPLPHFRLNPPACLVIVIDGTTSPVFACRRLDPALRQRRQPSMAGVLAVLGDGRTDDGDPNPRERTWCAFVLHRALRGNVLP
jgi:hypothetical protein